MPNTLEASDFNERMNAETSSLPSEFRIALSLLSRGEIPQASKQLNTCLEQNKNVGTASCLQGYCLKEVGKHREAIEHCRAGRKYGLGLVGMWYYFDVMVNSLNNIDDLQGALAAVNESVGFFRENNSLGDLADHLARKENILKQIASHFSRDESKQITAKECIIAAIQSICESLSISTVGWEDMEKELDALGRIAGRVGVKSPDLAFLPEMPHIWFIVEKYFSSGSLAHYATSENYNRAVDLFTQGNRLKACEFYEKAYSECQEETSHNIAFKALIAYFYGVNLLRMFEIENLRSLDNVGPRTRDAIKKIQSLWTFTLRAYKSLDPNFIHEFDHQMPPGLSDAVQNIREDRLMVVAV